jgi:serine/threonine-protein kinase
VDAASWGRLKEAFATLSELSEPERDSELSSLAEQDPDFARQVAELLKADAQADAVLGRFDALPGTLGGLASAEPNADGSVAADTLGYLGQPVGDYHVTEVLGIGGMGVVYKAVDTRLSRNVALKFLLPQYSFDPQAKERFLHEARAASSLDHPNVCSVYGVGTSDQGHLFIAMACYEGETLKSRLARESLTFDEILAITRQILLALGAAHEVGIVHRDLKPGNVMLPPDGAVRILDFGLAKVSDLSLTGPGPRPGTVAYMSPEQVEGTPLDHRTDLWSLGVVMYEMLTGQKPFGGGHDLATVYAILNEQPRSALEVRRDAPAAYADIVSRLLQKNRDDRYPTVAAVIADLDAAAAGRSVQVVDRATPRSRPRRSIAIAGVAIGGAAIAAVIGAYTLTNTIAPKTIAGQSGLTPSAIGSAVSVRSVAVLPFVDMSAAGDNAYFSDGITEEILNALAQVPDLRVPARTSSFSFKGRNLPIREIARQLGVAAVLEGSVRREGDQVRITAQLIDAQSDRHMWSNTFDRTVDDVFAIQTEIARTVAESLKVRHGDGVPAVCVPIARAPELYMQGRFYWNRRSGDDLRRAIGYFKDATRADSLYANAYAGLGLAYSVLPVSAPETPVEPTLRLAEAAARRAIALDSLNPEAYAALGYAYHWLWQWNDAERALRRATQLDPTNAVARQWYGEHLVKVGRGQEAEREAQRAVALDPLSPNSHANLALVRMLDGRYDDAIAAAEQSSRMDPSFVVPQVLLHRLYLFVGRYEESATAGRRAAELRGMPNADDYVTLARGPRSPNERAAALAVLDRWQRKSIVPWGEISQYAAAFGDNKRAIDALEQGVLAHAPMVTSVYVAPWLRPMRDDPRLQRLVRTLRFP